MSFSVSGNTLSHIFSVNTGAKMHQNLQICKLKFKHFSRAMPPDPMLVRGYGAPPQTPPPRRSGVLRLPRLARGLPPLHRRPERSATLSFYNLTSADIISYVFCYVATCW